MLRVWKTVLGGARVHADVSRARGGTQLESCRNISMWRNPGAPTFHCSTVVGLHASYTSGSCDGAALIAQKTAAVPKDVVLYRFCQGQNYFSSQ